MVFAAPPVRPDTHFPCLGHTEGGRRRDHLYELEARTVADGKTKCSMAFHLHFVYYEHHNNIKEATSMAKYGRKASQKVKRAMHERKRGSLRSGRSGKKVKSRKQAIAIGLSEARRAGGKVPRKKSNKK